MNVTITGYAHNGPDQGEEGNVYVSAKLPPELFDAINGYSGPALIAVYDTFVVVNVGSLHFLLDKKKDNA